MPHLRKKKSKDRFVVDARDIGAGEKRFAIKGDALAYIKKCTHDQYAGVFVDPKKSVTFGHCCDVYLMAQKIYCNDGGIGLAEYNNRERTCRQTRALNWNGIRLEDAKIVDLEYSKMKLTILEEMKRGWGKQTVKKMLVTFKQIFEEAIEQKYIGSNQALKLNVVGSKTDNPDDITNIYSIEDISCLSHDNIRNILNRIDIKYYLITKTIAMTGMRSSEAVALTWDQIDFGNHEDNATIYINKAYKRTEKKVDAPKTKAGKRVIFIPADLRAELIKWQLKQPFEQRKQKLVFPTRSGTLADYGNWNKRGLAAACKILGLTKLVKNKATGVVEEKATLNYRLLRHYFASILIFEYEATEATITQLMGHTDISFTKRQYAEWLPKRLKDDESSRQLGKAMQHLAVKREVG